MTEIEARVADLINFSSNQKPIEFEDAFKSILQTKVAAAIENKKTEIAQMMFNNQADEAEVEDTDTDTDNEDTEVEDQVDGEAA